MKLVEFVPPVPHPLWRLCLQMGITDVIVKVNPALTGLADPWRLETLTKIVGGLKAEGLTVVGLEGDPFDMTPIKQYGEEMEVEGRRSEVKETESRDVALAHYRELLESMAALGIRLLCYNFMVGPGWSRTGVRSVRGGAKATCFSLAEYESKSGIATGTTGVPPVGNKEVSSSSRNGQDARCPSVLRLDKDQVWANYEYFIKSVLPTAERLGVRMGLHPDDPCLPALGGYARIFETVADYDRAYEIYPSPSNAVTYCQANFKLMLGGDALTGATGVSPVADVDETFADNGQDARCASDSATQRLIETARHFGKRIAFIHVRDVEGDKTDFTELFHDQGTTDQFALMRTYRDLGLDVPVRGDHVPEMEGDRRIVEDCIPGYYTLGRLFANGYLKALLKGTSCT